MSVPALSASSRSSEGHWTDSLGFLLPAKSDVWWTVTPETLDAVVAEHVAAFRDVIDPHLQRSACIEWLIEEWESGRARWLTSMQRTELAMSARALKR